jgi:hypothetical protein
LSLRLAATKGIVSIFFMKKSESRPAAPRKMSVIIITADATRGLNSLILCLSPKIDGKRSFSGKGIYMFPENV